MHTLPTFEEKKGNAARRHTTERIGAGASNLRIVAQTHHRVNSLEQEMCAFLSFSRKVERINGSGMPGGTIRAVQINGTERWITLGEVVELHFMWCSRGGGNGSCRRRSRADLRGAVSASRAGRRSDLFRDR